MHKHILRASLLASGALLIAACASQPATGSPDEEYFQKEASNYLKFEHEGKTVYCTSKDNSGLIPYTGTPRCVTEARLRQVVEDWRVQRNPVVRGGPPYVATVPGGNGTR
jgi:hypothetical protein